MKNGLEKGIGCEKESKESTVAGIVNGLLWAAVILLAAWFGRGSQYAEALSFMTLSLSTIAFLAIERQRKNQ